MNLSFRKIIVFSLFFAFFYGAVASSIALVKSDLTYLLMEDASDYKADATKKVNAEEHEHQKLTFANETSLSFDIISTKYEFETIGSPNFLSFPPFSPPNA